MKSVIPLVAVFAVAAVLMSYAFNMAEWRTETRTLPRFCEDRAGALGRVRQILTETQPVGDEARRPYIVAAKLLYLIPQRDGEDVEAYLLRLGRKIDGACGG